MKKSHTAGRVLTAFIGVYHVWAGLTMMMSGETTIRLARSLAGWTIEGSPAMGILGEILGCYLIAFGLMMLTVAVDPVKGKSFITVGLVLIALRLTQRLVFSAKIMEVFQVDAARHWGAFAVVAVVGLGLLIFRLQLAREA
jgi:hypothetical protein